MLKNTLICFLSILFLYACNRNEKLQSEKTVVANDSLKNIKPTDTLSSAVKVHETVYFNASNTTIKEEFRDSLFTKFSDLSTDDKFTLNVPKGNINKTTSVLKIFNNGGEMIYEKSFDTYHLINGYDLEYIKSDEELEKYMLNRAKEILSVESFTDISDKNEIKKDDVLGQSKERFINYDAFIECQNNKTPLFTISLGEEDTTYIGYSKKLKKAVDIIDCC
ncbi:hypothetical protein IRZ71_05705 [Flavobacterium sp. ANB]|uniref:hypothetical protein n=1 Tax=unclassified Flavobacterium TaxID=196869 RepID=UPI0012B6D333|nr:MULTISPECIES: hypothetical protein [unclassified Flavobacterium]MBF4515826.1 hypothetical protein [Flavobacterium sp. ANB]MTD68829.1 hypothetical protein [Flavobacterium sp. LC2016-13]